MEVIMVKFHEETVFLACGSNKLMNVYLYEISGQFL